MYSCSCCSSLIEIQDFQGMPCISHPWYSTMIHAGHEPEKHEKTRLCVSCFLNMFYCLVSFAVNVLVSIFSWVLPRWPLGNLARDLAIKTTMGHTGKAWQSHHCSNLFDTIRSIRFGGKLGESIGTYCAYWTYWDSWNDRWTTSWIDQPHRRQTIFEPWRHRHRFCVAVFGSFSVSCCSMFLELFVHVTQ